MLKIDLSGKRAFVAGVGDDGGFGFAIAKHLARRARACASAPGRRRYSDLHRAARARQDRRTRCSCRAAASSRSSASTPFDADFDTLEDAPAEIRENTPLQGARRLHDPGRRATSSQADFGDRPLDIVVHSLANGPEVKKPLLETSRKGYLAAIGVERVLVRLDGAAASARCCARTARSCR